MQNLFILNLAVSDVIVCLLSLPITPVTNIYKNWYFGFMMCRMIPCVQGEKDLVIWNAVDRDHLNFQVLVAEYA